MDEKALTKRDIHTLNEQRRRDIIKVITGQSLGEELHTKHITTLKSIVFIQHGYAMLTELIPTCKPGASGVKLSRAVLLQKGRICHIIIT